MEPFEKAFDQLRRDYLGESAHRLEELRGDLDAFRGGAPGSLQALRTRFHRLVGSGGSYGFPEISSAAREAERWLGSDPPPSPDDADTVEGVIERLAVLFSEAEQMLRAAAERTGARLAVLAMPEGALADELREVLASAGFQVRVVPRDARPDDVASGEAAQLAILMSGGPATYAAAARWTTAPADTPRTVVLIEGDTPVDRLRAAVAGAELVLPAERAPTELARLAQRHVLASAPRFVAVLADDETARADKLAEALAGAGMEVRRASDPEQAYQHLELAVPDLVLASAALPDGGGRALARLVRQDPRCVSVPMVLMGAVSEEDRLAALREGVDEVLTGGREARMLAAELRARAERARRVRELVRRDPLTGTLGDPALRAELDHAIALARRDGRPLGLLLCTVEGVRELNMAQGHAAGDRLLAHAASVLRATLRQSDLIGRRGGRTFGVVLRGSGEEGAARIVAKLHAAAAEHPYETRDGDTVPLKFTIGQAVLGADAETTEDLLRGAE